MRALLLMSNTGGGHRAAAEALAAALQASGGVETDVVDAIEDVGGAWAGVTRLYGPLIRHAPWAWGALYTAFGSAGASLWSVTQRVAFHSVRHRLMTYAQEKEPDVVVSTHPLINQGLAATQRMYAERTGRRIPFAIVVTDPVTFHAAWLDASADLVLVATPAARERALALGMAPHKVHVGGFPVHPRFFEPGEPWPVERPAHGPVVLVSGGAEGLRHMPGVVDALLALPCQPVVLAVAGRDGAAEAVLRRKGHARLQVFGFTPHMPALMRACDVMVLKAGPGVLFEAMAMGTPVVVADALPGQEAGNVGLVRQHGLGKVAMGGAGDVAAAVLALWEDPVGRQAASKAGRALSTPEALEGMAQRILALARLEVA